MDEGVHSVGDFFVDGELITHDAFVRVHGVPQTLFLTYAQITRYIRTAWDPSGQEPLTHGFNQHAIHDWEWQPYHEMAV